IIGMVGDIKIISGGSHLDSRGSIEFVNDFDMTAVKRFYIIENADTDTIRGWRAHRTEQRWFYAIQGSFEIKLIRIDNWESPSSDLTKDTIELTSANKEILHLPTGYASAVRAREADSRLLVFADYDIDHAKEDDYVFPVDYFGF